MEAKFRKTIMQAYNCPLYREKWKAHNFSPDKINGIVDLGKIPFLTKQELFEGTRTRHNKLCIVPASNWFLGYDRQDAYEWFPYSDRDLLGISALLARMGETVGLRNGDIVLAIVDTPPTILSLIPYLWTYNNSFGNKVEFIMGSMEWYDTLDMSWITFIQKRKPNVIFSSIRNAQALAERIETINKSTVLDVLPKARLGLFYGKNGKEGITEIVQSYSQVEPYEIYLSTENMMFCPECSMHNGVHLWQDYLIPEIIPDGSNEAQLTTLTAAGTKGELVITNFYECIPLIRYKTGKSIRIQEVEECACGCNHPKVKFDS